MLSIRILFSLLKNAWNDWRTMDLDEPVCCPGTRADECGCEGYTYRQFYIDEFTRKRG